MEEEDLNYEIDEQEDNEVIESHEGHESIELEECVPLTPLNKIAMKCILHECIDQLYILRNLNSQDNANFINTTIEYVSIAERYMGMEKHYNYRINTSINNYEKLARDIHFIIQIIKDCREEIGGDGTFRSLKFAAEVMKRMREDERNLMEEKDSNDKYIIELRKQCEEERLNNIRTIDTTNAEIQKLRFEVEDLQVYTKYEHVYFESWEKCRREQNTLSCEKKEKYYQNIIEDMKKRIDREQRCHMELENYIEESKNDYLDEIQYWLKHYDEEIERRETEMINLKTNMEKLVEDHQALRQKYDARKAEIEDWLDYKRRKKEKEELEALQIWAAIKIQAWWRGVMFRKKLGPYRKKKGKNKAKDKKKGKKK